MSVPKQRMIRHSVTYSLIGGVAAGLVGVAQIVKSAQDFLHRQAYYEAVWAKYPNSYHDATNLVRGAEWGFLSTGLIGFGATLLLYFVTSLFVARITRNRQQAVGAAIFAWLISSLIYAVACGIVASKGLHPLALYENDQILYIISTNVMCLPAAVVPVWMVSWLGAYAGYWRAF